MPEERRGCRAVDSPLFSLVCASLFMVCVCVCFIFLGVSFFFFQYTNQNEAFQGVYETTERFSIYVGSYYLEHSYSLQDHFNFSFSLSVC